MSKYKRFRKNDWSDEDEDYYYENNKNKKRNIDRSNRRHKEDSIYDDEEL